jgi:hypothetical protein
VPKGRVEGVFLGHDEVLPVVWIRVQNREADLASVSPSRGQQLMGGLEESILDVVTEREIWQFARSELAQVGQRVSQMLRVQLVRLWREKVSPPAEQGAESKQHASHQRGCPNRDTVPKVDKSEGVHEASANLAENP